MVSAEESMSDRFTVTLPDGIGEDLQRWAESEGRAKANLAAFLLELAVRQRFPDKYSPKNIDNRTQ
jgi:hypothetical protein